MTSSAARARSDALAGWAGDNGRHCEYCGRWRTWRRASLHEHTQCAASVPVPAADVSVALVALVALPDYQRRHWLARGAGDPTAAVRAYWRAINECENIQTEFGNHDEFDSSILSTNSRIGK